MESKKCGDYCKRHKEEFESKVIDELKMLVKKQNEDIESLKSKVNKLEQLLKEANNGSFSNVTYRIPKGIKNHTKSITYVLDTLASPSFLHHSKNTEDNLRVIINVSNILISAIGKGDVDYRLFEVRKLYIAKVKYYIQSLDTMTIDFAISISIVDECVLSMNQAINKMNNTYGHIVIIEEV
jgi:hypothetical protein